MSWFMLSLFCALSESAKDLLGKKALQGANEYLIAWSWSLFAFPFLLPWVWYEETPVLGPDFWPTLLFTTIVVVSSFPLYMKAIRVSDLSLTLPMIATTPVFMLITSPIIVGESAPPIGILGVLLIAIGTYVLNIQERKHGWLAPYCALLKEEGPRIMLVVSAIWSIGGNLDKVGVLNSSPLFWLFAVHLCASLAFVPLVLWKTPNFPSALLNNLVLLTMIGILSLASGVFQLLSLTMTLPTYVIAVKRFSIPISVLLGSILFRESGLRERLAGVIIMIIGALLITLLG